jgi:hypothetical protein
MLAAKGADEIITMVIVLMVAQCQLRNLSSLTLLALFLFYALVRYESNCYQVNVVINV